MKQLPRQSVAHNGRRVRAILRRTLGYGLIVLGVILMPLPGPGGIVVGLGIAVLGRHDPLLRRVAHGLRSSLRRLSQARNPLVRGCGRWLRREYNRVRLSVRHAAACHAAGQPLPRFVWFLLIVSLLSVAATIMGTHMMLR